jgi:hypothetical protein
MYNCSHCLNADERTDEADDAAVARGFEKHNRATRKAEFLARMDRLMPWAEFCALIEPHYPKAGNGRPPVGLERMLRMYCIANWFNLGDETCEEAVWSLPRHQAFRCRIGAGHGASPAGGTDQSSTRRPGTLVKARSALTRMQCSARAWAAISRSMADRPMPWLSMRVRCSAQTAAVIDIVVCTTAGRAYEAHGIGKVKLKIKELL